MDVIALAKINALKASGGVGYTKGKWEEELPNTEIESVLNEEFGISMAVIPFEKEVEIGAKYKVLFDGVLYECVMSDSFNIGNAGLIGTEGTVDTGEPFYAYFADGIVQILCTEGKHTISLSKFVIVNYKIDTKYFSSIPAITLETVIIGNGDGTLGDKSTSLGESDSKKFEELAAVATACVVKFYYTASVASNKYPYSMVFNFAVGGFFSSDKQFEVYRGGRGWAVKVT